MDVQTPLVVEIVKALVGLGGAYGVSKIPQLVRDLRDKEIITLGELEANPDNEDVQRQLSDGLRTYDTAFLYKLLEVIAGLKSDQPTKKGLKPTKQEFFPSTFPDPDDYFTGREDVLADIDDKLKRKKTAALFGTHAIGKTSTIIEYAYRFADEFKKKFYILAATSADFDKSVSDILKQLVPEFPIDAKADEKLERFKSFLSGEKNWLMLLDNVDDVKFVKDCNLKSNNGCLLFTSNDPHIHKIGTKVEIDRMPPRDAALLIYRHWTNNSDAEFSQIPDGSPKVLLNIAKEFGYHAYAMEFVGNYLDEGVMGPDEFLDAYKRKDQNLLGTHVLEWSNYQHDTVAQAFLLRFAQITADRDGKFEPDLTDAVKIYLSLLPYLDTDNIPEELLSGVFAAVRPEKKALVEDTQFLAAIYNRFRNGDILRRDYESKTVSTHRIIQEIMLHDS